MSIWKHLTNLDAQEQHSLCSYPKIDQTGIEPEQKVSETLTTPKPLLLVMPYIQHKNI